MRLARALVVATAMAAGTAVADTSDALQWLRKIQDATQKMSYTGTFVYQHGGRTETSRITRLADPSGDIEKLEVMDGAPREIVRTRGTVRCYLPDSQVVKVDRASAERGFPSLLPERVTNLAQHYEISLGEIRRIAGYDCRAVVLAPRDQLRYGYRLYADVDTGMLLKAVTIDPAGAEVEKFTFTHLQIGNVTPAMVKPRDISAAWRIEDAAAAPARLPGWRMSADLPGFRKVVELKRRLGESRPAGQMVYSDGLAAVSVFIEPLDNGAEVRTGLASMGAIHIYTREVANHIVTVVGEAPAISVQRIADGVEYRPEQ